MAVQYWFFGLAAFCGMGVIVALKEYLKSDKQDLLNWASVLGLIGYAFMCANFIRLAYLLPIRAINFVEAFYYILKFRPRVFLSTGASPAVPFSLFSKIIGTKVIFVESLSRVNRPSLTGRIMYKIADEFYIQWPNLKKIFPSALYYKNLFQ